MGDEWWDLTPKTAQEERMGKLEALFTGLDADNDKVITRDEFVAALTRAPTSGSIWRPLSEAQAQDKFKEVDAVGPGRLTKAKLEQFVVVSTITMVRDKFRAADTDRNRQVDKKEFGRFFKAQGVSRERMRQLWAKLDKDGNGKVKYTEWRDWADELLAGETLDEFFLKPP